MSSEQAMSGRVPAVDFRLVRSVMEAPILDEHKWAKPILPTTTAQECKRCRLN